MQNLISFKTFRFHLSAGVAVAVAAVIGHYFFAGEAGWLVLAAFLTSLTTRVAPFRQGVFFGLTLLAAIALSTILFKLTNNFSIIFYLAGLLFVVVNAFFFLNGNQIRLYFIVNIFIFVLILTLVLPAKNQPLPTQILSVILGSAIGILSAQFIFPPKFAHEFKQGLIPVLKSLQVYLHELTHGFFQSDGKTNALNEKKLMIEKALQLQQGMYPEWVYEPGFNQGLRAGFRFFLIHLEHVIEIFFSMNYLVKQPVDSALIKNLEAPIAKALAKNEELIKILIHYFQENRFAEIGSDFMNDITNLEEEIRKVIPTNLELLDISADYLTLTAFVRDIKDLRKLLLQLVLALPNQ